jgi:hypothetical protein
MASRLVADTLNLGKLSVIDLLQFLVLIPLYEEVTKGCQVSIREKRDKIFTAQSMSPSWHHFYELTYPEHLALFIVDLGLADQVKQMAASDNPPQAGIFAIKEAFESEDGFDIELNEESRLKLPLILGVTHSLNLNFKSLLTFGLYINELVAIARKGGVKGDKALFNAIRIDPTVIGCTSISKRISQAVLEDDQDFIKKLKRAFQGKFTKRENRVYQLQRLIMQVLLEAKSPSLSAEELYKLFVEQLKIASKDRDSDIGDVANNLRQFAYQFMKQKSVS